MLLSWYWSRRRASISLTPGIIFKSLLFGLGMGLVGGLLPALKAARLPLLEALRAA